MAMRRGIRGGGRSVESSRVHQKSTFGLAFSPCCEGAEASWESWLVSPTALALVMSAGCDSIATSDYKSTGTARGSKGERIEAGFG